MKIFTITDPHDVIYPLPETMYSDTHILYHGTSSIYSEMIENNGWQINANPLQLQDFIDLAEIFKKIHYNGINISILKSYVLGSDGKYFQSKKPSFTPRYHLARNYATNPGGESITYFLKSIEDMLKFSNDDELKKNHMSEIENILNKYVELKKNNSNNYYDTKTLDTVIVKLNNVLTTLNSDYLTKSQSVLMNLKQKYSQIIKNHFPVIYVVSGFDIFDESDLYYEESDFIPKKLEINPNKSIPPSSILTKIIFPNGTDYLVIHEGIHPVKWEKENWNDWCRRHHNEKYAIDKTE
jgi:hypothetical protein